MSIGPGIVWSPSTFPWQPFQDEVRKEASGIEKMDRVVGISIVPEQIRKERVDR